MKPKLKTNYFALNFKLQKSNNNNKKINFDVIMYLIINAKSYKKLQTLNMNIKEIVMFFREKQILFY